MPKWPSAPPASKEANYKKFICSPWQRDRTPLRMLILFYMWGFGFLCSPLMMHFCSILLAPLQQNRSTAILRKNARYSDQTCGCVCVHTRMQYHSCICKSVPLTSSVLSSILIAPLPTFVVTNGLLASVHNHRINRLHARETAGQTINPLRAPQIGTDPRWRRFPWGWGCQVTSSIRSSRSLVLSPSGALSAGIWGS